jgi:hypothetical protein
MCRRVECNVCKKPTYAGCGKHIEQVLGDVPPSERCNCRSKPKDQASGEPSLLRRLFGL